MATLLTMILVAPGQGGELILSDVPVELPIIEVFVAANRTSDTWTIAGEIYRLVELPEPRGSLAYAEERSMFTENSTLVEWDGRGTYIVGVTLKPWLAGGLVEVWSVDGVETPPNLNDISGGVADVQSTLEGLVADTNLPGLSASELLVIG